MSVMALIPARSNSKGIPNKNWRLLGETSLVGHAYDCARAIPADTIVVSSDTFPKSAQFSTPHGSWTDVWLERPAALAQDDTPMLAVVQHALQEVSGPDDQIIVLLQPTQPFRTPQQVQQAVALLRETGADSVVSVVELPQTHNPSMALEIESDGHLHPFYGGYPSMGHMPSARQRVVTPAYIRDGTVYAFWRTTVSQYGTIYGWDVRPLIIPAEESCELDTAQHWADVTRRWQERTHG